MKNQLFGDCTAGKSNSYLKSSESRRSYSRLIILTILMLLPLFFASEAYSEKQAAGSLSLPEGFIITKIVDGLDYPVDMEFLPDGSLLVAQKGRGAGDASFSTIELIRNGVIQQKPVVTLSTNTVTDSGILALAVDPDFASNHFFYVWYTTGEKVEGWTGESSLRLSRFKLDSQTGTADPKSEQIILEDKPWAPIHHGNSPIFDRQGNLILGMGDRADRFSVQDLSTLKGKVIRIRPTADGYEIPADNPFTSRPGARPEIYAYGVRNPYRIADRGSDGLLAFGDVGDSHWEEVNVLQSGRNYGYPEREGPCPRGHEQPCAPSPSYYTDPIIAYPHDASLGENMGGAVTGMDFYDGTSFPAAYQNKLFFADFNQAFIGVVDIASRNYEVFAEGASYLVDIEYHNQGLYILDIVPGSISLISHTGSDNQIPIASMTADPRQGPAPLKVNFSAAGSYDPDDISLQYHWDFGDGSQPAVTHMPAVSHTYQQDGTYQARLKVVDVRGGESAVVSETITVYSGEFPTVKLQNLTDPDRDHFRGGDELGYAAERSNLVGLDPDTPYSWEIHLHHNEHAHPIYTDIIGQSGEFPVSRDNHGGDWNIWYRFYLTMHTSSGQEVTVTDEIFPELVDLRISSEPGPAEVYLNDAVFRAPHDFKSIVGVLHQLRAGEHLIYDQGIWVFAGWRLGNEDGGEESEIEIIAPQAQTEYSAVYEYDRPAETMRMPAIFR